MFMQNVSNASLAQFGQSMGLLSPGFRVQVPEEVPASIVYQLGPEIFNLLRAVRLCLEVPAGCLSRQNGYSYTSLSRKNLWVQVPPKVPFNW